MPGNFGIQSAIVAGEQIDQWLSTFPLDTDQKLKVHLMNEKESLERAARARGNCPAMARRRTRVCTPIDSGRAA